MPAASRAIGHADVSASAKASARRWLNALVCRRPIPRPRTHLPVVTIRIARGRRLWSVGYPDIDLLRLILWGKGELHSPSPRRDR